MEEGAIAKAITNRPENEIDYILRKDFDFVLFFAAVVFPPDVAEGTKKGVRQGEHVEDPCIKTAACGATILEVRLR